MLGGLQEGDERNDSISGGSSSADGGGSASRDASVLILRRIVIFWLINSLAISIHLYRRFNHLHILSLGSGTRLTFGPVCNIAGTVNRSVLLPSLLVWLVDVSLRLPVHCIVHGCQDCQFKCVVVYLSLIRTSEVRQGVGALFNSVVSSGIALASYYISCVCFLPQGKQSGEAMLDFVLLEVYFALSPIASDFTSFVIREIPEPVCHLGSPFYEDYYFPDQFPVILVYAGTGA